MIFSESREMTQAIPEVAKSLGTLVHDHLIGARTATRASGS
jgi:hypothetical protein